MGGGIEGWWIERGKERVVDRRGQKGMGENLLSLIRIPVIRRRIDAHSFIRR